MKKLNTSIILFIAIIIFANLVSEQYYFRIDLTEDKQYSLSNATKNILKDLVEPVTVKAYFSANLPPNVAQARKDLEVFFKKKNTNFLFEDLYLLFYQSQIRHGILTTHLVLEFLLYEQNQLFLV